MLINFLFGTNCMTEDISSKQLFIYFLMLDILFNSQVKQSFEICRKASWTNATNSDRSNTNYLHKDKNHAVTVYIISSFTS